MHGRMQLFSAKENRA